MSHLCARDAALCIRNILHARRSEEERALLEPFHMEVEVERSSKVGRLLGDWGLTPERTPASRLPRL